MGSEEEVDVFAIDGVDKKDGYRVEAKQDMDRMVTTV
jgi:hypothetical protein